MTSRFLHNGANGPRWNTTRMFRPVRQVAASGAKSCSLILSHCLQTFRLQLMIYRRSTNVDLIHEQVRDHSAMRTWRQFARRPPASSDLLPRRHRLCRRRQWARGKWQCSGEGNWKTAPNGRTAQLEWQCATSQLALFESKRLLTFGSVVDIRWE